MKETLTLVTCPNAAQARRMAVTLVRERLAACVNIVPGVTSIYAWKGKLERGREVLLLIKSRMERSKKLAARVKELHSYATPEVITFRIDSGSPAYLRWIRKEVLKR